MKRLLFSVTAKDCEWDYVRGSGAGGQKRNKTSSAVRCRHLPSGALGYSEDGRSQSKNRQTAFGRMANSPEFQKWLRLEIAKKTGVLVEIERRAENDLSNPSITVVESHDGDGRWVKGLTESIQKDV